MFVLGTLEVEFINHVDDLAHVESRANLVVQLTKNLAYLVFQTVRLGSGVLEVFEVREEFLVHKLHQVVATHGVHGVQHHLARLRVALLGRCPLTPTVEARDETLVGLAFEFGFFLALGLKVVKIF